MSIAGLRQAYHRRLCEQILASSSGVPNIADKNSKASTSISQKLVQRLDYPLASKAPPGQRAGIRFEQITGEFLDQAFNLLHHLRPGEWRFSVNQNISEFEQYEHLAEINRVLKENPELAAALGGDYLVTPDIVVGRYPVADEEINRLT